jgi:TusA-related sulfurtransferase
MSQEFIDTRRLLCPMPVIRVQDRVKMLEPGIEVEVICSDPGALNDIPAWCCINGHRLVDARTEGDEYVVILVVGNGE